MDNEHDHLGPKSGRDHDHLDLNSGNDIVKYDGGLDSTDVLDNFDGKRDEADDVVVLDPLVEQLAAGDAVAARGRGTGNPGPDDQSS